MTRALMTQTAGFEKKSYVPHDFPAFQISLEMKINLKILSVNY